MNVDEIIELFNDGELEIEKYFNSAETFFKIMEKRGRIDDLNLENNYMENDYLLYLSQTNNEKFREEVAKQISDVRFEEGKDPVLELRDSSLLQKLFCDGRRNDISQDTIGEILSGESDFDRYWDTTDDVYRDVIEELNEKNLNYLYEYIVNNLNGIQIELETELLQDIANVQNNEFATINEKNVKSIVNDSETMNYLLDNDLSELNSELNSIHSSSFNNAYENEVYRGVWDKLDDLFDVGKRKYEYQQHPYKKDTQIEVLELPIRDFYTPIIDYLNNGKGTSQTLEYFGSFMDILEDNGDCLSYWAPDYPSSNEIDKNINDMFGDYI